MTPTIWDTIADTPWWFFFFYAFLIRSGYLATKSKVAPYKGIRNATVIFMTLTLVFLLSSKLFSLRNLALWCALLGVGTLAGWLHYRVVRIKAIAGTDTIQFPGNWLALPFVAGLIYLHFRYGTSYAFNLDLLHNPTILKWLPAAYGLFAGLMVGKTIYLRKCVKMANAQRLSSGGARRRSISEISHFVRDDR